MSQKLWYIHPNQGAHRMNSRCSAILIAITIFFINVCMPMLASAQQLEPNSVQQKLAELEASSGGRLGIAAENPYLRIDYHANERFPFCSSFKVMAVSAILKQSMTDSHLLQQKVFYKKRDLLPWSPISEKHVADGMTISQLCAAAMMYSDNTAITLLMKKLGGPEAVTAFARSIGDNKFRLDRWETALNTAIPGDPRDTTTPAAMEKSLQKLAFGNVLASPQRELLLTWMKNNTTGNARIRAGVPKGWIVGDKTGTGDYGTTNDIGIIWPPNCPQPIVAVIYFTQNKKDAAPRDDVIAAATRILINGFISAHAAC
jgi:beta-lactamase class A